ncbi:MAG: hypothetical protein H6629_19165 [Calditrichae bacterium]|nr:hypothetical protein [Calditrichia bacterium]
MREQLSIFDLMQDDLRKLYDERAAIQQQIDEALSSDDQKTFEQCKNSWMMFRKNKWNTTPHPQQRRKITGIVLIQFWVRTQYQQFFIKEKFPLQMYLFIFLSQVQKKTMY